MRRTFGVLSLLSRRFPNPQAVRQIGPPPTLPNPSGCSGLATAPGAAGLIRVFPGIYGVMVIMGARLTLGFL